MEIEQNDQEVQQTQNKRSIDLLSKTNEFDGVNNAVARNYTGKKLKDMFLLKQLEDILSLYDKVSPQHLEQHLTHFRALNNDLENALNMRRYFTGLGVLIFLACKRLNPFVYQSYLSEIYTLPVFAFGLYNFLSMGVYKLHHLDSLRNDELHNILETKALIHSNSVKITNSLRYDILDLV